ncbi:MAG TPA: hypothetical protein VHR45_08730 [Thermoanaerobaculia bacterium]|nr:hypothetical protein [Thermoanaerobaculia bacterium]
MRVHPVRTGVRRLGASLAGALALGACAQAPPPALVYNKTDPPAAPGKSAPAGQSEADEYTRYELLEPASSKFHILYEVTATTPGAAAFYNPIRKGSEASGEAVFDQATSAPLPFTVVSGAEAKAAGLDDADPATSYIRAALPHPVPATGGVRLLIEKTYLDPKSYYREGDDRIVFSRSLGIRRNAVVLPAGYEVVAANVPAQVLTEPDGRIKVSFVTTGPGAPPVLIRARAATRPAPPAAAAPIAPNAPGSAPSSAPSSDGERLAERAHQDREIVYFLRQPESHAFDLYHDYTETRAGVDRYVNVVRPGSTVSEPAARNLDSGEALAVEVLRGPAIAKAGIVLPEGQPGADSQVVVAHFPPLAPSHTLRLRITETYTDPRSYRLDGAELVFDRSFGRLRNAVLLPAGWMLAASSIPATISEASDDRIRLDFVNPRPDEIRVLIKAKHRF